MKNFMKQNRPGLIFVRMILLVSIVVVAGCATRYWKEWHANEITDQKQQEKQQENPIVAQSEAINRLKQGTKFVIIEMDNEFGLSNDDFISYLILENEIRLNLTLHGGNLSDEKVVEAIDVFIEWLEVLKDTQEFEDGSLYDRIDELIYNQIECKAHLSQYEYINEDEWQELLEYFQNCREKGETFQDATNNCRDTLTKSAPELG